MRILMDESGNGNLDQPLIVGAVELAGDADAVEQQIRQLQSRLLASRSFAGHPKFENFRKHGFHSSSDPEDVSGPFLELTRNLFYRTYMLVTDRTSVPGKTEADRVEFMYGELLGDLLLRHRAQDEVQCVVEQSTGMSAIIGRLPSAAEACAARKVGKRTPVPRLRITQANKGDYLSMALIDYVMAATSRWLKANRPTDPRGWPYRSFREHETSISVLYSFEEGRISSRKDPLH